MRETEIIGIVRNGLFISAIKQVLQEINVGSGIEFKSTMQECLNGHCSPNYLIIDAQLIPDPISYTLEKVKTKSPECNILILNSDTVEKSAETYIHTLIAANSSENDLKLKFENFFSSRSVKNKSRSFDNTLSQREKEVVQLVALGKTNKEISDELYISTHTVITHRKNITSKLGIKTIAGLAVYAVLNELIDPSEVNK